MNTELKTKMSRTFNMGLMSLKKHSPEIMVVGGVIGMIVGGVMACKATTKAKDILNKAKEDVETFQGVLDNPEIPEEQYTEEDLKNDIKITYAHATVDLIKTYAPAVAITAASAVSILAGHKITNNRNVALSAALAAETSAFKTYKERVVERLGEEMDRELTYNIKSKEVEEQVVDENGEIHTEKKIVKTAEVPEHNAHTRCFDETSSAWVRDAETNKAFLIQQQNWANDKLRAQGVLSLNEVHDMLGLSRTSEGQILGWYYDAKNPNKVDFGIFGNINDESKRLFVNGHEQSVWLDFNVDGNILDYIK